MGYASACTVDGCGGVQLLALYSERVYSVCSLSSYHSSALFFFLDVGVQK